MSVATTIGAPVSTGRLLDQLDAVVDALTTRTATGSGLGAEESVEVAARLGAATDRLAGVRLDALGTVDASGVWGLDGARSAKAWLARTTGCSPAKAGSDLKLARNLAAVLPRTREAVLAGGCSLEQARALSTHTTDTELRRVLLAHPDCGEAFLLAHTGLGVEEFLTLARSWAVHADPDAADAKHRAERATHELFVSPTLGGGDCKGLLSAEVTEMFRTALRAEIGTPPKDDHRTPGQRNHDALGSLLTRLLNSGQLGQHAQVRPTLVVHVPFETLLQRLRAAGVEPAPVCTHGPVLGPGLGPALGPAPGLLQGSREPLPRSVLDKLACDSEVMRVVFGPDSDVIDLGRSERLFKGPLRRALDARDGGCRRPGCSAPPWMCIGHHKVPWLDGGPTSLDNGMLACPADHDWIHTHHIQLVDGPDGAITFTGPDGRDYGTSYPRGPTGLFP